MLLHGEERKQLTHDYDFLFFLSLAIWPDKGHRGALKKEERHSREINFVEFFLEGALGFIRWLRKNTISVKKTYSALERPFSPDDRGRIRQPKGLMLAKSPACNKNPLHITRTYSGAMAEVAVWGIPG